MAELGMDYDPDTVERGSFDGELIPAGKYPAYIVQSEVIPTKNGKGKMLKLRWDITEGPYTNRVIFDQINYQHESQQAQTIGQQQLKAICDAVGHAGPLTDSEVLHYKPILLSVAIEKGKDKPDGSGKYEDRNVAKGYKSLAAGAPPAGKSAPNPAPAQQRQAALPAAKASPPAAAGAPARPWPSRAA